MKDIIKNRLVIICLLIFALAWANYNLFFNIHCHVDETGHIILHAHPYSKNNDQSKPFHQHTKNEFIYLNTIFNILTFLFIVLVFTIFILQRVKIHHPSTEFFIYQIDHLICLTRRGPPHFYQPTQ